MSKEQFIHIDRCGAKRYYSDHKMETLHREDGPAVEWADGDKSWYLNGELHREDGPAHESTNGYKAWCLNGNYHREDGPAVEYADGDKEWWVDGKLHREDGPAIEYIDGDKEWYLNGEELTEDEFNARMNPVTRTLDEIASKFEKLANEQLKIKK